MKKPLRIGVSGGAGQICYSLLFSIASGRLFGEDQPVALHILEVTPVLDKLTGVVMELHDCAFPLLSEIVTGDDPHRVFHGVDFVILVGAKPRSKGMERADLLQENAKIFVDQAKALNHNQVKVLVVGNPANTNALVLCHNAADLPVENVRSMMRLDQNRALFQLSKRAKVPVTEVKQVAVFGNHSPTMVVDYHNAVISGKPAQEVIRDDAWLRGEFMMKVQQRGGEVLNARGLSSAASAANAILDSIRDWTQPTAKNDWYSAGIHSKDNPYEIDDDLFFSFAMRDNKRVDGLNWDEELHGRIKKSEHELIQERDQVRKYL